MPKTKKRGRRPTTKKGVSESHGAARTEDGDDASRSTQQLLDEQAKASRSTKKAAGAADKIDADNFNAVLSRGSKGPAREPVRSRSKQAGKANNVQLNSSAPSRNNQTGVRGPGLATIRVDNSATSPNISAKRSRPHPQDLEDGGEGYDSAPKRQRTNRSTIASRMEHVPRRASQKQAPQQVAPRQTSPRRTRGTQKAAATTTRSKPKQPLHSTSDGLSRATGTKKRVSSTKSVAPTPVERHENTAGGKTEMPRAVAQRQGATPQTGPAPTSDKRSRSSRLRSVPAKRLDRRQQRGHPVAPQQNGEHSDRTVVVIDSSADRSDLESDDASDSDAAPIAVNPSNASVAARASTPAGTQEKSNDRSIKPPSWCIGPRDWHGHCIDLGEASAFAEKLAASEILEGPGRPAAVAAERLTNALKTKLSAAAGPTSNDMESMLMQQLEEVVEEVRSYVQNVDGAEHRTAAETVEQILSCVLPRLTIALVTMLRCFGLTPTLNLSQLNSAIMLTQSIISLHTVAEDLRQEYGNLSIGSSDRPLLQHNIGILARVKKAHRTFNDVLSRHKRSVENEERRRQHSAERARLEAAERIRAAREAKLSAWRKTWSDLHAIRRAAEFANGRTFVSSHRLEHLAHVPVAEVARPPNPGPVPGHTTSSLSHHHHADSDLSGSSALFVPGDDSPQQEDEAPSGDSGSTPDATVPVVERDANGEPMERLSMLKPRTWPPVTTAPVYSGPPFSRDEDAALARVLVGNDHAGDVAVWATVIMRLCRPRRRGDGAFVDAELGAFNVCEIVERGVWLRDRARVNAAVDGAPQLERLRAVVDPRVMPVPLDEHLET